MYQFFKHLFTYWIIHDRGRFVVSSLKFWNIFVSSLTYEKLFKNIKMLLLRYRVQIIII